MPFLLECRGFTFGPYMTEPDAAAGTFNNFPAAVCGPAQDRETGETRMLVWATPDHRRQERMPVATVRCYDQPSVFNFALWRISPSPS